MAAQPSNVKEAMDQARWAAENRGPAEVVSSLFLVCAFQQQHIEDLELAVGIQHGQASEAVRSRGRQIAEQRAPGGHTLLVPDADLI